MSLPKLKLFALSAALCAASALLTAALLWSPSPQRSALEPVRDLQVPAAESPEHSDPGVYVLRSMDGELCVFRNRTLLRRTGVYTLTLPREDRELLENGISAASQEALASLLEDLCS